MRIRYHGLVLGLIVGLTPSGSAQGPKKEDPKALVRGRAFAEAGRVDLFLASSAAWDLPADDDRNWDPALKLALELARSGKLKEWPPGDIPKLFLSMADYRAARGGLRQPVFKKQDRPYEMPDKLADGTKAYSWSEAILAPGVSLPNTHGDIILSRGDVKIPALAHSVVFATGDVTVHGLRSAVVVCDGDVIAGGQISDALVVARGNIRVKGERESYQSVLVAGGKVTIEKPHPNQESHVKIKEDEKYPFSFVRFFELSRVGVSVVVADKVVRITDVADARAFALAGAREGDVIESVNGTKPESAESLRRLLRDALAVGDATVKVRRGDKVEALTVTLPAE